MSVRVLVVDDEAPARRKVRAHLAGTPGVEVVGEAASGPEAVEAIRSLRPDLVFLDVQMPGMTGFEVIEAVGVEAMPAVVFVTAYDEFALDAFEVQAVDYLMKPFHADRLRQAVARARERISRHEPARESLARLLQGVLQKEPRELQRLLVREGERMFFVPIREIVHLTADGNYVKVHTAKGAHHQIRETLASLEAKLDAERFARIHRSEIVNLDYVAEIQPFFHGDYTVLLKTGEQVRLSRRFQDRLLSPRRSRP
jgi:two-component system LytT family response regulator